jgi:hypothetical protein
MRDLFPALKFTTANGMAFERGKPVPFSCAKKDANRSERAPVIEPGPAN